MGYTHAMRNFFVRSEPAAQSQDERGHQSTGDIANSPPPSSTMAYVQNEKAHHKAPQSSAKEHELGQRLQEKEIEVLKLRAYCQKKFPQMKQEMQSLLDEISVHKENGMLLQRNADARARLLQERLTTAEQELEACRDDLFRTQPVCQISDAGIIDSFESLGEQLVSWIDDQGSAFEYTNPEFDFGSMFLLICPSAGEYLCRHIVNRYLLKHIFGPNLHFIGVPAEYAHMLATVEQGMAALRPPRDSQRIDMWRAETLSALSATQGYADLKEEHSKQVTANLFACLAATFPNLHGEVEARKSLHEQVTVPAMAIVSKLQGLASTFTLDMASGDLACRRRMSRNDVKKVTAIDLKTGKRLKHGSPMVEDRNGAIGDFVLSLEPGLRRVREGGIAIDLRKETWLVRLDENMKA